MYVGGAGVGFCAATATTKRTAVSIAFFTPSLYALYRVVFQIDVENRHYRKQSQAEMACDKAIDIELSGRIVSTAASPPLISNRVIAIDEHGARRIRRGHSHPYGLVSGKLRQVCMHGPAAQEWFAIAGGNALVSNLVPVMNLCDLAARSVATGG
jgi:hypothetical protein